MKPAIDRKVISGIKKLLADSGRFVIIFHRNPDGDALASAFLLCRMLAKKGKESLIVSRAPIPPPLSRFPFSSRSQEPPDRPAV